MLILDKKIEEKINEYYDRCKELADYITLNPELGCEEEKAVSAYKKLLEQEGFIVQTSYKDVPNAFHAVHKSQTGKQAKKIALMCEYDALPDLGHACGHSISGAASLLAALALQAAYPDLSTGLEIVGTPGEEYTGGQEYLSQKGAFDNYEYAAMAHMMSSNQASFPTLACNDRYIIFTGKSSHASVKPEAGINALNAARLYMDAMDMWRQHLPKGAQFHGVICKGGELPSIVPDNIELNFYFRAYNLADLDRVCEISENCCKAAAIATECTYTAEQKYLTYADLSVLESNQALMIDLFEAMDEPYSIPATPSGSTDAGNVDYKIPVFHPMISATGGKDIPVHNPAFEQFMRQEEGYNALLNAAKFLANLVLELDRDPERLSKIQQEHTKHRSKS